MTLKSLECMYIPIFLCILIPYIVDMEANQMFIDIKHGAYRDIVNSLKKKTSSHATVWRTLWR